MSWRPSTSAEREARGRKQAERELALWATEGQLRDLEDAKHQARIEHRMELSRASETSYDRDSDLQIERFWRESEREAERPYDFESWRTEIG